MKCVNCGVELAEGAKFCGACGTKVVKAAFCSECGAAIAPGAKFCSECGHRCGVSASDSEPAKKEDAVSDTLAVGASVRGASEKVDEFEEAEASASPWDGPVSSDDISRTLDDLDVVNLEAALEKLQKKAKKGRVLTDQDGKNFEKKIAVFADTFTKRTGVDAIGETVKSTAVGIVDYSQSDTGRRGVVVARLGIFYISSEYPKVVDGECSGGVIPWKLFYKFSELSGRCIRMRIADILASDEVDAEVKEQLRVPEPELVVKAFLNAKDQCSGIDDDAAAEFWSDLKDILSGNFVGSDDDGLLLDDDGLLPDDDDLLPDDE